MWHSHKPAGVIHEGFTIEQTGFIDGKTPQLEDRRSLPQLECVGVFHHIRVCVLGYGTIGTAGPVS